jgi:Rrf2 family protein
MLTQTADYALRALIYLAHDPDDGYHQTCDLARALNTPANYLGKILQLLRQRQIVESQRGMNGGFRLCRLPEQIRLFDVLDAIEAVPHDPVCPLRDGNGRQLELCLLHRRFAAFTAAYVQFLKETTLADVLQPDSFPGACPGPAHFPADGDKYPCPEHPRPAALRVLVAQ